MERIAERVPAGEGNRRTGGDLVGRKITAAAYKAFVFALLAAPPAFFYFIVFRYSSNVPIWDDYEVILDFLLRYQDADGALQKLRLVFAQHSEHRLAFSNVATLALYKLSGAIDLRSVIRFGSLGLAALVLVFYWTFRERERKALYFAPVVLFLFQPQFYEAMMWAMASVSNFYVLVFSFGSILLLRKDGRFFFALAFFLAALASVTQGSGIFALAACALFLLLKRDFRGLALWCALSGTVLALYFGFYEKPANHPSVTKAVLVRPVNTLRYFFTFIGASFPYPFLMGLVFASFFLFLTWRGYYRKNPALYCGLVYVFMTAAVTALTRSGFSVEQALSSRYRIVSVLFPMLMYMAFSEFLQGRRLKAAVFFPAVLAGAVLFNVHANVSEFRKFPGDNFYRNESMRRWAMGYPSLLFHDYEEGRRIMLESIDRGIYEPDMKRPVKSQ